ncbi:SurA N-terminal domain-containing protein [Lichenicoccus sp.]|uniref:peptidylprolyl isomerase n=1 Tax=Lichenicoccus sp. TaxID=2781899 RepID=UPI003D0B9D17
MISYFRHLFVDSWLGRVFAGLIFVAFVAWGVSGVFSSMGRGGPGVVATVQGEKVTADSFDSAFRQQLAAVARQTTGGDVSQISQAERGQIAMQVLQGLVGRAEALREATDLGIVVPDPVLRDAVFAAPLFKGTDGKFDRTRFDRVLQAEGMTEATLLSLFRDDLKANALIESVRIGAIAPAVLVRHAFDYAAETRTLDMVRIPFASMPPPPAADDATLQRYFDNHPDTFKAPQYRRIKLVVLSPRTVARSMDVSEADERAAFKELVGTGQVPEKRSVQVITAPSQARAEALAVLWRGGAGWPQMQAAATDSIPVKLDDAPQTTFPEPALGALAFGAKPGEVAGPAHLESGWVVLKVTKVTAATTKSFAAMRPKLHDEIAEARASDGMADRTQKLQDAVAGGSGLDQIPGDIGAVAAEGTLDAQGMTQDGLPAPLPGSEALRQAILAQAFAQKPGAPAEIKQGPKDAEFALIVEKEIPARPLAFAAVQDKVRQDVREAAIHHAANTQAAALFASARSHHGLAALGRTDIVQVGPIGRGTPPPGVPAALVLQAFGLAPGKSTMLQTPGGFVVATVTGIQHPGPQSNRLAFARMQTRLDQSVADDIEASYAMALRRKMQPRINAQEVRSVVGQ